MVIETGAVGGIDPVRGMPLYRITIVQNASVEVG